jgi:hypothetical protein
VPPLPPILLTGNRLSMCWLIVVMPLLAPLCSSSSQHVAASQHTPSTSHSHLPLLCPGWLLRHFLSHRPTHSLYTLPPLNTPAGCSLASHCDAFATHPLDVLQPLNILVRCSVAFCCAASAAHTLSASLPLNVPPPPPTFCLLFVCPGWLPRPFSSMMFCGCGGQSKGVNLALTCALGK